MPSTRPTRQSPRQQAATPAEDPRDPACSRPDRALASRTPRAIRARAIQSVSRACRNRLRGGALALVSCSRSRGWARYWSLRRGSSPARSKRRSLGKTGTTHALRAATRAACRVAEQGRSYALTPAACPPADQPDGVGGHPLLASRMGGPGCRTAQGCTPAAPRPKPGRRGAARRSSPASVPSVAPGTSRATSPSSETT
jgi:hypothetical protein